MDAERSLAIEQVDIIRVVISIKWSDGKDDARKSIVRTRMNKKTSMINGNINFGKIHFLLHSDPGPVSLISLLISLLCLISLISLISYVHRLES